MTAYFCWKCKTKDHWANEICPKVATPLDQPVISVAVRREEIKKAEEFLRKVGRTRIYPDW